MLCSDASLRYIEGFYAPLRCTERFDGIAELQSLTCGIEHAEHAEIAEQNRELCFEDYGIGSSGSSVNRSFALKIMKLRALRLDALRLNALRILL